MGVRGDGEDGVRDTTGNNDGYMPLQMRKVGSYRKATDEVDSFE